MLLPSMIKEKHPNTRIGFFLHIPFPSLEIFRLLIWRKDILRGLLGADLIGFHTYDYVRHFLSSARGSSIWTAISTAYYTKTV
jgi:trehalose 6-phosphate synthase/phosphatase